VTSKSYPLLEVYFNCYFFSYKFFYIRKWVKEFIQQYSNLVLGTNPYYEIALKLHRGYNHGNFPNAASYAHECDVKVGNLKLCAIESNGIYYLIKHI
jgi:hypothetical protein